ncbi:hypothetical protein G7Z17_g10507 [Cylindrodendrum hubeiense]|uniref:Uncharacterized protein n=1 Tax=Cylindrodendrum hubeiense TaxID=595255 RepID=A0A9P5H207_9HYPO|nr:hypothetical protein G7Z17_g10507 [Cylindrodendrum hubeiense]
MSLNQPQQRQNSTRTAPAQPQTRWRRQHRDLGHAGEFCADGLRQILAPGLGPPYSEKTAPIPSLARPEGLDPPSPPSVPQLNRSRRRDLPSAGSLPYIARSKGLQRAPAWPLTRCGASPSPP